jgi:phosphonate degradation associated HDIG domain protein
MNRFSTISDIDALFEKWGQQFYSEMVSQTSHAVQCAQLAEQENASSALVLAALLHDVGHLMDLEDLDGKEVHDFDTAHEATGSRALASVFPPAVTAPIAMHVDAKRWLCAKEEGYSETLSEASIASLALQGGPMSDTEADRFMTMPHFDDAISLRRWDDFGKDTSQNHSSLDEFHRLLHSHFEQL